MTPARHMFACTMLWLLAGAVGDVLADGAGIDKIYHPYVQPLERELELRASLEDGSNGLTVDRQIWRLGYGQSFGDRLFGEFYLIGEKSDADSFRVREYELEALMQLTEQGEYAADLGLLIELGVHDPADIMEISAGALVEKDWQRLSATANLKASYEFGDDIDNELESALALQARYRLSPVLEPGVEFYSGEDVLGIGPVLTGNRRYGPGRQLHWEAGVILGLKDITPDRTFRFLLEYEF